METKSLGWHVYDVTPENLDLNFKVCLEIFEYGLILFSHYWSSVSEVRLRSQLTNAMSTAAMFWACDIMVLCRWGRQAVDFSVLYTTFQLYRKLTPDHYWHYGYQYRSDRIFHHSLHLPMLASATCLQPFTDTRRRKEMHQPNCI